MSAIEVTNVSKVYPLRTSALGRLRQGLKPGAEPRGEALWALRDVSFSLRKGETFGIVGANGSGKSTLLQIVAGIARPSSGSVSVEGRLSALLELGSGFAPEFSGRQNVYLNAAICGLSRDEVDERFATIEAFADVGDFMDRPIRTYSTGMILRVAFAVAAHIDPEVLVVDEALAVGDIAFRQRCMRRIHDLRAAGTTVLFVSHDSSDLRALCERCLWLERGEARMLGETDDVVSAYLHDTLEREKARDTSDSRRSRVATRIAAPALTGTRRFGTGGAEILEVSLLTMLGPPVLAWAPGAAVVLRVSFRVHERLAMPIAGFLVRNSKGENIFGSNTARENFPFAAMEPEELRTLEFKWTMPDLAPGRYFISVAVADGDVDRFEVWDHVDDVAAIDAQGHGVGATAYLRLDCSGVSVSRG